MLNLIPSQEFKIVANRFDFCIERIAQTNKLTEMGKGAKCVNTEETIHRVRSHHTSKCSQTTNYGAFCWKREQRSKNICDKMMIVSNWKANRDDDLAHFKNKAKSKPDTKPKAERVSRIEWNRWFSINENKWSNIESEREWDSKNVNIRWWIATRRVCKNNYNRRWLLPLDVRLRRWFSFNLNFK